MRKILENFRENLEEAAVSVEDAMQDRLLLVIEEKPQLGEVVFYLENTSFNVKGTIEIEFLPTVDTNYYKTKMKSYGPCLGAYQVTWSEADQGYGPLMYDIAIEWATKEGTGLTCDRAVVSKEAYRVWEYYLNNRSDVKHVQLDDLKNTLTRTEKDNCLQMSARQSPGGFPNSPLSKVYIKTDSKVLNTFKSHGRITSQHSSDAMDNANYGYFDDGDAGF